MRESLFFTTTKVAPDNIYAVGEHLAPAQIQTLLAAAVVLGLFGFLLVGRQLLARMFTRHR